MHLKHTIILLLVFCAMSVNAETIKLKLGEQGNQEQIQLPERGMKKSEVEKLYGPALSQTEARGEPPISIWHYSGFSVYFENEYVIHSVVRHQPKNAE